MYIFCIVSDTSAGGILILKILKDDNNVDQIPYSILWYVKIVEIL